MNFKETGVTLTIGICVGAILLYSIMQFRVNVLEERVDRSNKIIETMEETVLSFTMNPTYPLKYQGIWTITAYTSRKCETDDTPFLCEPSGYLLQEGRDEHKVVACNDMPLGKRIYILTIGWVTVVDRTSFEKSGTIDIWVGGPSKVKEAKKFGLQAQPVFIEQ